MSKFISPALIAKIYGAFDHHQRARALTLLRQAFFMQRRGILEDNQFICELERMASENVKRGDFERAEQYYRLALYLYEHCFFDQHLQAICCFQGLIRCLQSQKKTADLYELLRLDDLILGRVKDAEQTNGPIIPLFADHRDVEIQSA